MTFLTGPHNNYDMKSKLWDSKLKEMMIKLPVVSIPTGGFSPSNCDIIGRLSLLCTDSIWIGDCYLLHVLPQVIDTCFLLAEVWVFANNQLTGEFFS